MNVASSGCSVSHSGDRDPSVAHSGGAGHWVGQAGQAGRAGRAGSAAAALLSVGGAPSTLSPQVAQMRAGLPPHAGVYVAWSLRLPTAVMGTAAPQAK